MKDDAQLIDATLAGDTEAFGELVCRYQNRLFNTLYRILGCREDAHDATQEAFITALCKLKTFRGDAEFYTWLYRIGFNVSMTARRKSKPTTSLEAAKEQAGLEPEQADANPMQPLEQSERAETVHRAMARLKADQREILVLREIEDNSYETIAQMLEIPIGTVRSRLARARKQLKLILEEDEESCPSPKSPSFQTAPGTA